ncbi:argininosuccinate lyase [Fulvivirga kasyanovii]|uniref:Argininosuccinate lyase n=1 Tax=Fulvivirga kasyanovii TaxID=396812 RepID=A0ABW9RRB5_9BACT|nr:argininosuccinate lyase [Fulvivirga kasyanovii]MTI26729.1 argininosuccinate lyase [Fulvivirga kasyanovii]
MKLWDKGYTIEKKIETFTVGNDRELDLHLAKYDALGSLAHAQMLKEIGLISAEELEGIEKEISLILNQIVEGSFEIEAHFEDVHSKIEHLLTEKLGEAGKKIHTARSRNDQVLVDLHLFARDEIQEIKGLISKLFDRLIALSEQHKDVLLPGYTHFQVAMPSSFGLWFGAYAESLIDDIHLLNAAFKIADQNPLGSAAGYGSSFPINRTSTTEKMGFSTLKYNSVAAQMSRGKLEKSMSFGLSSAAGTLSKLAMDVCLYMSQNFGFITFPDHLTTGSSIMPHKKNPDVFELVRAKCNKIQALPTELIMITNNLPSGYHRDFQILKESLFSALFTLKSCLEISEYMLQHIIINKKAIDDPKYDYLYTVESVNKEVIAGLPFREAYQKVGQAVQSGAYAPDKEVKHTHEGSIGNLCNEEIKGKMREALG